MSSWAPLRALQPLVGIRQDEAAYNTFRGSLHVHFPTTLSKSEDSNHPFHLLIPKEEN